MLAKFDILTRWFHPNRAVTVIVDLNVCYVNQGVQFQGYIANQQRLNHVNIPLLVLVILAAETQVLQSSSKIMEPCTRRLI